MKLKKIFAILPLAVATLSVSAESPVEAQSTNEATTFQFSTEVSRTVEKDLMQATVYSRKNGKSLEALKKDVSANLNKVIEQAKAYQDIEVQAEGITNYVNYNEKQKVDGWIAEGYINLKSKNFDAIAKVLNDLGEDVAVANISFSVSPEKMKALEDEMTLEVIQQFQHKAAVIQKGLSAKRYLLVDVQLNTPNGNNRFEAAPMRMAKMASSYSDNMPLEAGKENISAVASGKVRFE